MDLGQQGSRHFYCPRLSSMAKMEDLWLSDHPQACWRRWPWVLRPQRPSLGWVPGLMPPYRQYRRLLLPTTCRHRVQGLQGPTWTRNSSAEYLLCLHDNSAQVLANQCPRAEKGGGGDRRWWGFRNRGSWISWFAHHISLHVGIMLIILIFQFLPTSSWPPWPTPGRMVPPSKSPILLYISFFCGPISAQSPPLHPYITMARRPTSPQHLGLSSCGTRFPHLGFGNA